MEIKRYLFTDTRGNPECDILACSDQMARFIFAARFHDAFSAMFDTVKEDGFGAYYIYNGTEEELLDAIERHELPIYVSSPLWYEELKGSSKVIDFVDDNSLFEMAPLSARHEVEDEEAEAARAPKDQYALNGVSRRDFC